MVQTSIIGLSEEARQLAELTYTFLVRVFSTGPSHPAAAGLRAELPACLVSDVMSTRRKVKIALLRKVEGQVTAAGGGGDAGAGGGGGGAGRGPVGPTQEHFEVECAHHYFGMTGTSWSERRVVELGRVLPVSRNGCICRCCCICLCLVFVDRCWAYLLAFTFARMLKISCTTP